MNTKMILILLIIFSSIFTSLWLYSKKNKHNKLNKLSESGWSCVEGNCEIIVNGKYKTKTECINKCKDKDCEINKKTVKFGDDTFILKTD